VATNRPHPYVGWLRRPTHRGSRKWRAVCSAPTEAECQQLLDAAPRAGACEMVVLHRKDGRPEDYFKGTRSALAAPTWRRRGRSEKT
jgi:hypothetical protein